MNKSRNSFSVWGEKQEVPQKADNQRPNAFCDTSRSKKSGTPSRTRTWDPLIMNQTLDISKPLYNKVVTAKPDESETSCEAFLCGHRPDLAEAAEAWDRLPEAVRAGIMAMVRASGVEEG